MEHLSRNMVENFKVHGSVHRNNILTYIQQDATLHSWFYLETTQYVSGSTTPIIRSANNCVHSIWWQIPDAVDTVVCAPDNGWWYNPRHIEQFPDKMNCVTLHFVGYTGWFKNMDSISYVYISLTLRRLMSYIYIYIYIYIWNTHSWCF